MGKKSQLAAAAFADSLHGLVQLLHEPVPKNLLDLLLRLAPGRNRLFQELASLWCQAKRLRAAILVGHNFQPATSLHSFDVAAEGRNVEMQMFANFNGASRTHLGGGDQNVHLAHLQVERPQGVVVDVGDDAIQHAQPNGNALAGDLVNHRLHMLGSHFMPPNLIVYATIWLSRGSPVIFPEESESGRGPGNRSRAAMILCADRYSGFGRGSSCWASIAGHASVPR